MLASIGWPVLDRIHLFGDFAISPHGIGIAVGFLFGAWILQHEGPKRGVSVEHINTMVFWALIGTIIGARLFFVIGHFSEFDGVADMLALWNGGLTLLGGIAGAILINIPLFRRYHYSFFQVMDGAVIGLAFGIAFGRIGDLIIGDHLGKPTSWLLAFQYEGGNLSGFACAEGSCRATSRWPGARSPTRWPGSPHRRADSSRRASGSIRRRCTTCSSRRACSWCCTRCRGRPGAWGAHARVRRGLRGDASLELPARRQAGVRPDRQPVDRAHGLDRLHRHLDRVGGRCAIATDGRGSRGVERRGSGRPERSLIWWAWP